MGVEVFVIALAGLLVPILLILTAVLVNVFVISWVVYRWTRDSAVPGAMRYAHDHLTAPIQRFAHSHHLLPH
jgi:uncharacterized membrane protein